MTRSIPLKKRKEIIRNIRSYKQGELEFFGIKFPVCEIFCPNLPCKTLEVFLEEFAIIFLVEQLDTANLATMPLDTGSNGIDVKLQRKFP